MAKHYSATITVLETRIKRLRLPLCGAFKMATTICTKCGNSCDVIFRPWILDKNGNKRYPKNSRVFPIPVCGCDEI